MFHLTLEMDMGRFIRFNTVGLLSCFFLSLAIFSSLIPTSLAYNKFIVGDDSGWVYPLLHPDVDYTKWASGKNFFLGDSLIFNYPDKNHSVVITHDQFVYSSCDYKHHKAKDYDLYGELGITKRSEVPLVETGTTYLFCGTYNGEHCKGGMKFEIYVQYSPANLSPPSGSEGPPGSTPTGNPSPPGPPEESEPPPFSTTDPPPFDTTEPPPFYGWSSLNVGVSLHSYSSGMIICTIFLLFLISVPVGF